MRLRIFSWVALRLWVGISFLVHTLEWSSIYARRSVVLPRGSLLPVEVVAECRGHSLVGMVVVTVWVGMVLVLVSSAYGRFLVVALQLRP